MESKLVINGPNGPHSGKGDIVEIELQQYRAIGWSKVSRPKSDSHEIGLQKGQPEQTKYPVSRRRWAILVGICTFGFLNGIVYVDLLDLQIDTYVYLLQPINYIPLLFSLPTAWFLDRFGLRKSIFLALALTIARNSCRSLLFLPQLAGWLSMRMFYWYAQGILTSLVVTIYYCLPLKVSEAWFSEKERALAWTLILVVPTIGSSTSQLVVPHFVTNAATVTPLVYVNIVALFLCTLVILVCVTRSSPKQAPSERSARSLGLVSEPMWSRIKRILSNSNILIQMVTMSTYNGLYISINSVLQDILAGAGLSQVFCGQFLAMSSIVAFIIQFGSSYLMKGQKTNQSTRENIQKQQEELDEFANKTKSCKYQLILMCLAFQLYAISLNLHHLSWFASLVRFQWIAAILGSILFVGIRCWSAPRFNDLLAQLIAGSISEATVTAAANIFNFTFMNFDTVVFIRLRRVIMTTLDATAELPSMPTNISDTIGPSVNSTTMSNDEVQSITSAPIDKQNPGQSDYTQSITFACFMAISVTIIYVLFFDPQAKRNTQASRPSVEDASRNPTNTLHGRKRAASA